MSLTLYYHPLSSFCWKALIALYENETPFVPRVVDLGDEAQRNALLKLWPLGKFPVLQDEAAGSVVPESSVIIEYLDGLALTYAMWPNHARMLQFYVTSFVSLIPVDGRVLEIGPGHGLLSAVLLRERRRQAAARGPARSVRRRASPPSTRAGLRHTRVDARTAHLGGGRRLHPGRLRGSTGALLRKSGASAWRARARTFACAIQRRVLQWKDAAAPKTVSGSMPSA